MIEPEQTWAFQRDGAPSGRAGPWDARLAAHLVRPLAASALTPNHLTTVRLLVGLAGAFAFAAGSWPNLAAVLIAASTFLDHTDGELARISGRSSRLGHYYDLASDFIVMFALFLGIGIGLSDGAAGRTAVFMGIAAGLAVAIMFHLRHVMERAAGKALTRQPALAGFEPEDVFYLLPLVTLFDGLAGFLLAAGIGAPLAALLVVWQYLRFRRRREASPP